VQLNCTHPKKRRGREAKKVMQNSGRAILNFTQHKNNPPWKGDKRELENKSIMLVAEA
jgi:hypothetical protein